MRKYSAPAALALLVVLLASTGLVLSRRRAPLPQAPAVPAAPPGGAAAGRVSALPTFAADELRRVKIGRDSRLALLEPAARLPFAVPADAMLRVDFALQGSNLKRLKELEIDFIVAFEHDDGRRKTLHRQRIGHESPLAWQGASLDLGDLGGERGVLLLETEVVKGDLPLADFVTWTPPALRSAVVDRRPNIVLLSIDTLRADHLGCYGYERDTSPAIDKLAREGVLFRNALASSSWTLPSHASMLTGLSASRHGAVRFPAGTNIAATADTLAELLASRGYATAGFSDGGFVSAVFGFDRGFEIYSDGPIDPADVSDRLGEHIDRAGEWLGWTGGRPFFLFLHTYAVHSPYSPLPPYDKLFGLDESPYRIEIDEREEVALRKRIAAEPALLDHIKALYDAEIRQTDATFGRFLAALETSGVAENTCVIVTSDHGEEFMEHGRLFHRRTDQYEELLRIPLVVACPGRLAGGRIVEDAVSLVDVVPTILDLVGAPIGEKIEGRSLLPSMRDSAALPPRLLLSETDGSLENRPGAAVAMRSDPYKLVTWSWRAAPLLFDLSADPGERHDMSAEQPDIVSRLLGELPAASRAALQSTETKAESAPPRTPDAAMVERLRALGYLQDDE